MNQTINLSQFRDAFQAIRPDNFSYDGLGALYEWLEDFADDCGREYSLDVIALCCEFSEMDLYEINTSYCLDGESFEDMGEAIEWLQDRTTVIHVSDDLVIVGEF